MKLVLPNLHEITKKNVVLPVTEALSKGKGSGRIILENAVALGHKLWSKAMRRPATSTLANTQISHSTNETDTLTAKYFNKRSVVALGTAAAVFTGLFMASDTNGQSSQSSPAGLGYDTSPPIEKSSVIPQPEPLNSNTVITITSKPSSDVSHLPSPKVTQTLPNKPLPPLHVSNPANPYHQPHPKVHKQSVIQVAKVIPSQPGETLWSALQGAGISDTNILSHLDAAAKASGLPYYWTGQNADKWITVDGESSTTKVLQLLSKYIQK